MIQVTTRLAGDRPRKREFFPAKRKIRMLYANNSLRMRIVWFFPQDWGTFRSISPRPKHSTSAVASTRAVSVSFLSGRLQKWRLGLMSGCWIVVADPDLGLCRGVAWGGGFSNPLTSQSDDFRAEVVNGNGSPGETFSEIIF